MTPRPGGLSTAAMTIGRTMFPSCWTGWRSGCEQTVEQSPSVLSQLQVSSFDLRSRRACLLPVLQFCPILPETDFGWVARSGHIFDLEKPFGEELKWMLL